MRMLTKPQKKQIVTYTIKKKKRARSVGVFGVFIGVVLLMAPAERWSNEQETKGKVSVLVKNQVHFLLGRKAVKRDSFVSMKGPSMRSTQ